MAKAKPAEIGPFPASTRPLPNRPGLYKRISDKTGAKAWAWWDGRSWFRFDTSKKGALRKKADGEYSKKNLKWIGFAA